MGKEEDQAAAERFREGDPSGLEELYADHADAVFRYICFLTPHPDEREEVFQDTWVRLATAVRKRGAPRDFRPYVVRIARNLLRDRARRNRVESALFTQPPGRSETSRSSDELPDSNPGPREWLNREMVAARVAHEVRRLPAGEREVFLLRMEGGLKFREIADLLGRPVGTVLARMRRATMRLRKRLRDIEL